MGEPLFEIFDDLRKEIISSHRFYVEQAQDRLLSQFDDLEGEADKFECEWLDRTDLLFDPEMHDADSHVEQARQESFNHYVLLVHMLNRTRFSIVLGMFHEWEKQIKSWSLAEIQRWHSGDNVKKSMRRASFTEIIDLFEDFGWPIRAKGYYSSLNRCRLVSNSYKHGDGDALEEIKKFHPEFLMDVGTEKNIEVMEYLDHRDLRIRSKHIDEFSEAITEFWKDVPECILNKGDYEKLPRWFVKSLKKDSDAAERKNKK